jgi:Ca2+-binding RTX toxin-like protein
MEENVMATIKYYDRFGAHGRLSDFYTAENLAIDDGTANDHRIIYVDSDSHNKIVLTGEGLSFDGNEVVDGTITGIKFENSDDQQLILLTDGDYTAAGFDHALQTGGVQGMLEFALKGKDTITGSTRADDLFGGGQADNIIGGAGKDKIDGGTGNDKIDGHTGSDFLFGGIGDDRLTGGLQADMFAFEKHTGDDVITDFDVDGSNHDFIGIVKGTHFTEEQHGKNLVLDFGDGDTLTLLNVDKHDFSNADVQPLML